MCDKHPLYGVWKSMKVRCYNKNRESYKNYGGRGITVCEEWLHSFSNFYNDMIEYYEEGLTLDRIDNNMDYSKDNCRWVDRKTQGRNQRTNLKLYYEGEYITEAEMSERTGISRTTIQQRRRSGKTGKALYVSVKKPALYEFRGELKTIRELSEMFDIKPSRLNNHMKRKNLTAEEALYELGRL